MQEKIIKVKGRQAVAFPKLVKALMSAAKEGWTPKNDFTDIKSCRMYSQNWFEVTLVKEDDEGVSHSASMQQPLIQDEEIVEIVEEVSPITMSDEDIDAQKVEELKQIKLDRIDDETTKKGLLNLAMTFEIEVPEDTKKNVKKLKKFLRDVVNK